MRALELLKQFQYSDDIAGGYLKESIGESIKEIEDLIQENKSLTKTLEKYNEEMIKLRIEKKELIQVLIDAQETINKILEK